MRRHSARLASDMGTEGREVWRLRRGGWVGGWKTTAPWGARRAASHLQLTSSPH